MSLKIVFLKKKKFTKKKHFVTKLCIWKQRLTEGGCVQCTSPGKIKSVGMANLSSTFAIEVTFIVT